MADKIAVFETSEIFEQAQEGQQQPTELELKTSVEDFDGTKWYIYSRGNLERALDDGYTVYVASTRHKLGDHDAWWVEMVGRENVFLAGEEDIERAICLGWYKVYEKLGLEWPVHHARPFWWTGAREALRDHGVKLGVDFRRPLTRGEMVW